MRVLVTGGAGYLGAVVSLALLRDGHHVTVFDRLSDGGTSLLAMHGDPCFVLRRGDLRSLNEIRPAVDGVDAVVHLAAMVGQPICEQRPGPAEEINVTSTLQLLDVCADSGVERFVFGSSCSVYGETLESDHHLTEDSTLRPKSLYAETKVRVENAIGERHSGPMAVTTLRFATSYGLSPRMRFDLGLNWLVRHIMFTRTVTLAGPDQWLPHIHVRDVAGAVRLVVNAPRHLVQSEVFNVGATEENYRRRDIVDIVRAECGRLDNVAYSAPSFDRRDYRVSFEKIRTRLGFVAMRKVTDGVRELISFLSNGGCPGRL